MPNITVTINGAFTTFYRSGYSNFNETMVYSGEWSAFKDGVAIGKGQSQDGLTFEVLNFRLDHTDEGNTGGDYGYSYKRRYYVYTAKVTYPDEWQNVSIQHKFVNTAYTQGEQSYQQYLGSISPKIFLNYDLAGNYYFNFNLKLWPTIGTINEEGLVTYPQSQTITTYNMTTQTYDQVVETPRWAEGQQNKSEVNAVLDHLLWDWGDGTIDTIPLTATEQVSGSVYVPNNDGSGTGNYVPNDWITVGTITAPVTHTYHPDSNGDGTGKPIKLVAVDSVGRKSAPVYSYIGPHIEIEESFDESTNSLILDTSKSYGRTGKITTKVFRGDNPFDENRLLYGENEDGTENELLYRYPLIQAGNQLIYAETKDDNYENPSLVNTYYFSGYSAAEPTEYNADIGGNGGDERYQKIRFNPQRPPYATLEYPDGTVLIAQDYQVVEEPDYPDDYQGNYDEPYITHPQFNFYFLLPTFKTIPLALEKMSAPIVWREGMTTYIAGKDEEDGEIKLFRCYEREILNWGESISTMWEAEYYHAAVQPLIGGGAISVALKRVEYAPAQTPTRYKLELWSRKTFDLENWDEEPVKVYDVITNGILLEETLSYYPLLINESLSDRTSRIITGIDTLNYKSENLGLTWAKI